MASYLNLKDDDEDTLTPLDEESPAPRPKPRWWDVAAQGPNPSLNEDSPVAKDAANPEIPGAMREGPKAVPGPMPVDERVRQKTAALEAAVGAKPKEGQPKWWQRLAAGAAGFGAGYVNADGKNHPQIDASGAVDTIMGGPQKRQRLSDWRDKVSGAELGLTGAEKERDAWFKGRQLTRQEDLADAQIDDYRAQAEQRKAAATAKPKHETKEIGGSLYEHDPDTGKWNKVITGDAAQPKTLDALATSIIADPKMNPDQKKAKLEEIRNAHNILNPDKPVIHWAEGKDGTVTAVTATPSQVAAGGGSKGFGQIGKPQQVPVSAQNRDAVNDAIERVAQGIAGGDTTQLNKIASLRGDQRLLLYDRIKQLNPKFDIAGIDRKIKMEDYYANGQGAKNLQSFGTFLEHGGTSADAAAAINQSNPKLLNKPINWWKTNMSGDPAFVAFQTSLEPVRKEFEGFLLGGRALYGDDRKQAEIILNDASSLGQVQAALKAMGHTAQARMNEENFRYKKVSGHDLVDPFSPEAIEGGRKIGVTLGGGQQAQPNPSGARIIVHASDGKDHPFNTEAEAKTFEELVKQNHGTTQRK